MNFPFSFLNQARRATKAWRVGSFDMRFIFRLAAFFFMILSVQAETTLLPAQLPLGGTKFENWSGLTPSWWQDGTATWKGLATYRAPDGPKGFFRRGLMEENDSVLDLRPWYGLRLEIKLAQPAVPLVVTLQAVLVQRPDGVRHNLPDATQTHLTIQGEGWQTVTIPFASLDYSRGQVFLLKYIKELRLTAQDATGQDASAQLRQVRLVAADVLRLSSEVLSRPAEANATVTYPVTVTNCAETRQHVRLSFDLSGWEGMSAQVAPASLILEPGQSQSVTVSVKMPDAAPPGSQETQKLVARSEACQTQPATLNFITLRRLPFPYLLHTAAGWEEVRAKVAKHADAKESLQKIVAEADQFDVPEVPPGGLPSDQGTQAIYKSYIEKSLLTVTMAWKLTGQKKYAEKLALFLRRLADPQNGYPTTLHAVTQGIPQEGGFFEGCAWAYDSIYDAEVLSAEDKANIEQTFRLYIGVIEDSMGDGGISNWSVFNLCPAAECALALQDMDHFNRLKNGPCGLVDQLRYGAMSDGWWYEMSLSYNLGCAGAFTHVGLAAEPFGLDFLHEKFPVAITQKVGLRLFESDRFLDMDFRKYGPIEKNYVTIKQLWDALAPFPDDRALMFGMGDGHESFVGGGNFELAYFAFRDPAYAGIIKQSGGKRDLLFGVADLPVVTPKLYTQSAKADNAGLAVLRSQTDNRPPRQQIQASFKYGTHGGYHGHFDRLALNSLMRYGRSFFNPETSWFGYGSYMYKWWVQVSLAHNMVVVDAKLQEPNECRPLLFHAGKMMQVSAAETTTRWSNPPYFGMYDLLQGVRSGDVPFVPIPENHPAALAVTDFSEPVDQRRVMIVTDDYVVLADDLHGTSEHQFDQLLDLRGAALVTKPLTTQTEAQFDPNPLGSGQFITGCQHYTLDEPALIHSIHRFAGSKKPGESFTDETDHPNWETGGAKSLSVPGVLQIDEHVLWPLKPEIVIGRYAENWNVNKKVSYTVRGDGKTLAEGTFGAWLLGKGQVEVDISGLKTLQLEVSQDSRNAGKKPPLPTLFWGNPVIVTAEGQEIPLRQLAPQVTNVLPNLEKQGDYAGGPVTLSGLSYDNFFATNPADLKNPAVVTVDLTKLRAVRFKGTIGGDWVVGNEEQVRKVVSVRSHGTGAQFLTLLEPYETSSMVKAATATDAHHLHVELADGRRQDLAIEENGDGKHVTVQIKEGRDGIIVRTESTGE